MITAAEVIALLGLEPLPEEGGLFRRTYCAAESLPAVALPGRYRGPKPFGSAIYYLLTADPDSFSALHRLPTDEIYHFYLGAPVEMLLLYPEGRSERTVLGPDLRNGQRVQRVVPAGTWQGARLVADGDFALLGATMAPAFTPEDYVGGDRELLSAQYPAEAALIRLLTRLRASGEA